MSQNNADGKARPAGESVVPGQYPPVFVAVAVIRWEDRFLLVYNDSWGAYTFPMTKQRRLIDEKAIVVTDESWQHAAIRATTEWTGAIFRTGADGGLASGRVLPFPSESSFKFSRTQGDRDGKLKEYHFKVFDLTFDNEPPLVDKARTLWLSKEQILDLMLEPISKTARTIIAER